MKDTSRILRTGHRRRWYLDWLRGHFLHDVPSGKPTRRLYLSRADAKYRRVANEDQVMNLLAPLGFEKIIIGERSIFEQSALFAQAETVLASHTTAFANILFCSPGARVIDFIAVDRLRTYMYELAATMGLDYYYAFLEWNPRPNQRTTQMDETIIPLDRLKAILRYAKIN